jgi:hypothetical protein
LADAIEPLARRLIEALAGKDKALTKRAEIELRNSVLRAWERKLGGRQRLAKVSG